MNKKRVPRHDYLFRMLWDICTISSKQAQTKVDLDTAFALLKDYTREFSGQKDRIDKTLYSCLSDLAAIHDLQASLEAWFPLAEFASLWHSRNDLVLNGNRLEPENLCDLKVRDRKSRDFTSSGFDTRCKALLKFLKVSRLEPPKQLTHGDGPPANIAMHLFWMKMRQKRLNMLQSGAEMIGVRFPEKVVEDDLGLTYCKEIEGIPRLPLDELEVWISEVGAHLGDDAEFDADPFGTLPAMK